MNGAEVLDTAPGSAASFDTGETGDMETDETDATCTTAVESLRSAIVTKSFRSVLDLACAGAFLFAAVSRLFLLSTQSSAYRSGR